MLLLYEVSAVLSVCMGNGIAAFWNLDCSIPAPRVTATRKVVAVRQARDSVGSREKERVRRKLSESALPAWIQQQQQLLVELSAGGQGREAVVQELLQKAS